MANRLLLGLVSSLFHDAIDRSEFHEFHPIARVAFDATRLLDPYANATVAIQLTHYSFDPSPFKFTKINVNFNYDLLNKANELTHHLDRFSTFLMPFTSLRSLSRLLLKFVFSMVFLDLLVACGMLLGILSRSAIIFADFLLTLRTSINRLRPNACKI